ncbi:hypothetical protein [Halobacterium wangiae]|uniref:hypothetical protein n=1 Tax=Halobacterium wangiae TaxID=2902623 RepID=UPI001E4FDB5E|nr:hypothetical protein [Halobacterium wangiae]
MRKRALLVVALVVLAGCNGLSGSPATPENPQTTATSTDGTTDVTETKQTETDTTIRATTTESADGVDVTERDATLGDVDATAVWQRVDDLLSVDAPAPPPVVVQSGSADSEITPPLFWQSFGAEAYWFTWESAGGRYNPATEQVELVRNSHTTDEKLEVVLAHEFAHVYYDDELDALPSNASTFVQHADHEGAVEHATWQYAAQYTDVDHEEISRASFQDGRPYTRYFQGG